MSVERIELGGDPEGAAAGVRAQVPAGASVEGAVREVIGAVRSDGDNAIYRYEQRFGGAEGELRVSDRDLNAAVKRVDRRVREALELAAANVEAVAVLGLGPDRDAVLPQGQRVALREVPVARAAIYAPGGRAPYPSSVVMGVVTARAAGVEHVAVCGTHPVMLAAARLTGADVVYRMRGAQAIAALAYGTETVDRVDVIAGPGSLYVQEAKRQVSGDVGIDGFAGPSDLVIVAGADADPGWMALDLLAQAEHGEGTLVVCVSDSQELLDAVGAELPPLADALAVLALAASPEQGLAFAEALAPEHLQLVGEAPEALAAEVRRAGCLFVGPQAGTAFGDYVAGSNHTLPTQGAARFASGLSARHFRRVMAEVRMPPEAAQALAPAGAAIARAEGFTAHAASMEARMHQNPRP